MDYQKIQRENRQCQADQYAQDFHGYHLTGGIIP